MDNNWGVDKFKNDKEEFNINTIGLLRKEKDVNNRIQLCFGRRYWNEHTDNYIKGVYRWDGIGEPQTPTIEKNTGKITDWKEQKGT
ncbi:DUF3688 family protein [Spiroplasma phoeniceum]|uniref:Spiroplasma plectrovirus-related protein n=1 Tax=Spiroplasma phoeniceum P40 TaxID=1276259 RepID=A0A345DSE1_9MOLU|nr:DUF3688 family protein [Spiroplasma phoeniceum]AXF97132.1 spiroplasma plectrovirus-related protein [Spiroplasma phoeniceum P40]